MSDVMVTGRMTAAKKRAGNRVLAKMGMNASQAINKLYDYLIEEGKLPFSEKEASSLTPGRIEEACAFVNSMSQRNRLSQMTDDEVRADRFKERYGVDL